MSDAQLKRILQTARTVASVGVSSNPAKPSYGVVAYLKSQGYHMIPVNPGGGEILGEKAYVDLVSIPEPVDVVQLFRPSEEVMPFVQQAIQIGAKVIWMQEGISNEEAAQAARAAGLEVVMDQCMRVSHRLLIGEHFSL
jgi:predicted CoA-binding protein